MRIGPARPPTGPRAYARRVSESSPLPVVAVLWNSLSTSPFLISESAKDLCRLVWVVDASDEASASYTQLLRRFGTVVDSCGPEALAEELQGLGVGGVLALNDPPLRLGAALSQRLGTRFHTPATAEALTDKLIQRAALAAAGVPSAAYVAIAPGDDPPPQVPLPAVLKPREGASSRDVSMVRTPEELAAALVETGGQPMLLEEYLCDRDDLPAHRSGVVSVESYWLDGEVTHVGITGRLPLVPPFRETGTFHPADVDHETEQAELEDLAARTARAVGVRDGFVHIEIKRTPDGPRVVEINGRLGGLVPEMRARAGGPRLIAQTMRLCLGLPLEPFAPLQGVGWTYLGHAAQHATEVVAVEGVGDLVDLPDVVEARLDRGPGSALDSTQGSFGTVYTVDGHSPGHASMIATVQAILERVRIQAR